MKDLPLVVNRKLRKIQSCYWSSSKLNRLEFFIATVIISIISIGLFWVYSSLVSIEHYQVKYLMGKSIFELIICIAMIPIYIARLRDMNWPIYIAYGVIPVWLFTTRNLIIYMSLNNIKIFKSPVIFYTEIILGLLFLSVFIFMLFFRPANKSSLV